MLNPPAMQSFVLQKLAVIIQDGDQEDQDFR